MLDLAGTPESGSAPLSCYRMVDGDPLVEPGNEYDPELFCLFRLTVVYALGTSTRGGFHMHTPSCTLASASAAAALPLAPGKSR